MINISKNPVAPASLATEKAKANGSYREQDVVDALVSDSFNKCYLCEDSCPTTINVEHFKEHRGNRDLMFDWNNLHYSCGHCNSTKNDTFRGGSSDILNCSNPDCLVDKWIIYRLEEEDLKSRVTIMRNEEEDVTPFGTETDNTVLLLNRIYNGTGTAIRNQEAYNLRQRIQRELVAFNYEVLKYVTTSDDTAKSGIAENLRISIAADKPFAAFKRWILRDININL